MIAMMVVAAGGFPQVVRAEPAANAAKNREDRVASLRTHLQSVSARQIQASAENRHRDVAILAEIRRNLVNTLDDLSSRRSQIAPAEMPNEPLLMAANNQRARAEEQVVEDRRLRPDSSGERNVSRAPNRDEKRSERPHTRRRPPEAEPSQRARDREGDRPRGRDPDADRSREREREGDRRGDRDRRPDPPPAEGAREGRDPQSREEHILAAARHLEMAGMESLARHMRGQVGAAETRSRARGGDLPRDREQRLEALSRMQRGRIRGSAEAVREARAPFLANREAAESEVDLAEEVAELDEEVDGLEERVEELEEALQDMRQHAHSLHEERREIKTADHNVEIEIEEELRKAPDSRLDETIRRFHDLLQGHGESERLARELQAERDKLAQRADRLERAMEELKRRLTQELSNRERRHQLDLENAKKRWQESVERQRRQLERQLEESRLRLENEARRRTERNAHSDRPRDQSDEEDEDRDTDEPHLVKPANAE